MTNEEKANELRKTALPNPLPDGYGMWLSAGDVDAVLIKMAKWKDEQHSIAYVVTRCEEHDDYVEEVFFDIEKAEQYCAKYNSNDDDYRRHITTVNITL